MLFTDDSERDWPFVAREIDSILFDRETALARERLRETSISTL